MKYIHLLALTFAATAVTGCGSKKEENITDNAMPVTVAYPEIDSLVLHKSYPAYVTAIDETDIVARVNGFIVGKEFTDGEFVKKGHPMFIIESTSYRDQVEKAEAELQSAIASHEYAAKQYEAMKKALESDAVSKMDVNQAESNLRESEAAIKNARAQLNSARTMLSYCTTRAPYDCYPAKAIAAVSDYVSGEASPVTLVKVYDNSQVFVHFSIENDAFLALKQTKAGQSVDLNHIPVSFNDSITPVYYGKINYEAPDVDKSTGTVTLRIVIDNPKNELKSGMFASVNLPYAVDPKAIVIKDASIGTDQLGKYVYVVNDSDKVVYTPIQTGELYHDTLRSVSSGLKPTDSYVTQALMKVRDGMTVKPVITTTGSKSSKPTTR